MGITIDKPGASERRGGIVADRRLWLNAAGDRLVEDGDSEAAQLLASRAGKMIDRAVVDRLGLVVDEDGRCVQAGQPAPPKAAMTVGLTAADLEAAVEAVRGEVEGMFRQAIVEAAAAHGIDIDPDDSTIDDLIVAAKQAGADAAAAAAADGDQGASAADGGAGATDTKEGEAVQADQKADADKAPADSAKAKAPAADKARKPAADKSRKGGQSK